MNDDLEARAKRVLACKFRDVYNDAQKLAEAYLNTKQELTDLEHTFQVTWEAGQRAIKRWQEATGRSMTWPDHADLCVWLMEQLDKQEKPYSPSKLKAYFFPFLDDKYSAIVAAKNQKEAAKLMGMSPKTFSKHGGHEVLNPDSKGARLALSSPGVVLKSVIGREQL